MSLTSHLTTQLALTVAQMERSLITLNDKDLRGQREELLRQSTAQVGASPAGLVLTMVDREIARREQRRAGPAHS